jgi:hypothetical protein
MWIRIRIRIWIRKTAKNMWIRWIWIRNSQILTKTFSSLNLMLQRTMARCGGDVDASLQGGRGRHAEPTLRHRRIQRSGAAQHRRGKRHLESFFYRITVLFCLVYSRYCFIQILDSGNMTPYLLLSYGHLLMLGSRFGCKNDAQERIKK